MRNTFWLIPDRLAGRCGPTFEPWSLAEIRAAGIHAVLNLSEFEPSRTDFEAAGLVSAWFPLPNTYPADAAAEAACLRVLPTAWAFLDDHLRDGRNVLVHCTWGRDRTGLLLAYHLVRTAGLTAESAIARVREVRPKALSATGWESMAARVIAKLLSADDRRSGDR